MRWLRAWWHRRTHGHRRLDRATYTAVICYPRRLGRGPTRYLVRVDDAGTIELTYDQFVAYGLRVDAAPPAEGESP